MHTNRCRFAKTDVSKCRCSCKGVLHGLKLSPIEETEQEQDREMLKFSDEVKE